jgi:O-antigen/teichoic acid export membrane protein
MVFHSNFHARMTHTMVEAASTQERTGVARVGANVMSNWGNYVFTAIVSFFLAPFVVGHLGASGYGVWTLVVSLTGYLGLLDMGVRGAVTRYVAKYHAQEEHEEVGRIVSSAFVIFVSVGVLAILTSIGLALFAIPHFSIPAAYVAQARVVLVVGGLNVAVSLISGVFGGIIIGLQRFDLSNILEVLITGIRSLFVVLALKGGGGILALSGVQLAFSVLGCVGYYWLAKRLCPHLKIAFNQADRRRLSLIFSFSTYSFVLQISAYLVYYTDSIVIGAFLQVKAITFFAIAGNLMSYARAPITSISVTMAPLASAVEARSDSSQLRQVTLKACRYATAIMLPVAITFLLRGRSFIGLWMGASYAEVSGQVLSILTIAWLFGAGNAILGATMMGISKHKGIIPAQLGEGLCNLALSLMLVQRLGVVGVAWGTTIPNLGVQFLFWPWYLRRVLGTPVKTHVFSTWIRPAAAAIPFAVCTYATERWFPATNLAVFFLQVAAVLPLWLAGLWFFVIDDSDRKNFVELRLRPRFRTSI